MDPKAGFREPGGLGASDGWSGGGWMTRMGLTQDFMPSWTSGEEADDEGISALKNVTTGAGVSENKAAKFKTADRKGVTKKSLVVKKPTAKGYS
jgi:hypothetical protein